MVCGIYKITNKINNLIYIGQSIEIEKRWHNHLDDLNKNKHVNKRIQTDFNLHGETNFLFEVIQECDPWLLYRNESIICYEMNVWDSKIGYNKGKLLDYRNMSLEKVEEFFDKYLINIYQKNKDLFSRYTELQLPLEIFLEKMKLSKNDTLVFFRSLTGEHEKKAGVRIRITTEYLKYFILFRPHNYEIPNHINL